MKKFFTLSLLVLALAAVQPASAQVKFGLKAGLNVTDMKLSEDVFDASNKAGWFIGPTVKFSLPIVGLGIDASALYDYRSAEVDNGTGEKEKVKQQQIAIPVNLRYGVGLGSAASGFIFAGPQWGINIGDKNFDWTTDSSYSLKKSNFSINVGLGVSLLQHLQVTANYNIACGKTADVTTLSAAETLGKKVIDKSHSRNNSWQIAVAYYF